MTNASNGPPFTVDRYGSLGDSIIAERDWLRLELERLRKLMDGKTFVTDDEGAIDQLHAAVKTAQELAATRLMEVERLREALEKISMNSCDASETHYNCYLMESVTDAARAALNPETPK